MATIKEEKTVSKPVIEVYELVKDLKRYPEFIPWCTHVVVVPSQNPNKLNATVQGEKLGFKFQVNIVYSLQPNQMIEVYLDAKPFRSIKGIWRFASVGAQETRFSFELDYEFNNAMLGWTLTPILKNEIKNIVNEFEKRVKGVT